MKLAPRDTWPELRVTFLPIPWTWRKPWAYVDDGGVLGHSHVELGPFIVEVWGQDGGWKNQFFEREQ